MIKAKNVIKKGDFGQYKKEFRVKKEEKKWESKKGGMRISAEAVTVVVVVIMVTHDEGDGLPLVMMVNQQTLTTYTGTSSLLCSFSHHHVGFLC